jgi:hypothetical protein
VVKVGIDTSTPVPLSLFTKIEVLNRVDFGKRRLFAVRSESQLSLWIRFRNAARRSVMALLIKSKLLR